MVRKKECSPTTGERSKNCSSPLRKRRVYMQLNLDFPSRVLIVEPCEEEQEEKWNKK